MKIIDNSVLKALSSDNYNFAFNKKNGQFVRWGKTPQDDPDFSPYGTEILDIEISSGDCLGCKACYKSNMPNQPIINMSLDTFKKVFNTFPPTLTQIAFGLTRINSNPDFWEIMKYSRDNGIIPNYTTSGYGVTKEVAEKTADICGAVAVSLHNKEVCYDAVKQFSDANVSQINIHYILAEETIDQAMDVFDDIKNDERLKQLKAIVFLQYKPKGRDVNYYTPIRDMDKFKTMVKYAEDNDIGIGFDSCSAGLYLKVIEDDKNYEQKAQYVEGCESGLFSFYMNAEGQYFPCSFTEGEKGWEEGIDGLNINTFDEVWFHPRIMEWRENLINSSKGCDCKSSNICRSCPIFREITACKNELIQLKML